MLLPQVGHTYAQERRGISAVQRYAADHIQIFRETPTGDVGIDGQIEFVTIDGAATGQTLALQIKAGPSFFEHPVDEGWKFYPEAKHRHYWEHYPLPVILVLHHTDKGVSFWVDARQALRSPSLSENAYIVVPSSNVLEQTPPLALFSTAGVQKEAFIESFAQLLRGMIDRRTKNACFPLSFFDLFCGGLTNICRSIYFGTDLAVVLSNSNIFFERLEECWGMGGDEHDFLFDFVKFLISQHLAHVDFSDSLIDIVDRGMTPTFIASLTWRGRRFVSFVQANEATLIDRGVMTAGHGVYVAQEAFVEMVAYSLEARLERIFLFQKSLPA